MLLANIEGTTEYKPLGSGTYDRYFCEFAIEEGWCEGVLFQFGARFVAVRWNLKKNSSL